MFTQRTQGLCTLFLISLNTGTGELSVNKWENKVTCITYGQVWWPILRICALHLIHPRCARTHTHTHTHTHSSEHTHTHTAVNTHTQQWTHTRSSGQSFMLQRPGSSWGFSVLLKGTSVVVLKEERALYIHSPTYNSCQTWDSNSQPLGYKSNSLTIRPQLPPNLY